MNKCKLLAILFVFSALAVTSRSAFAQATIQANVTGGGGSGKCTFEIRTGGVAEVDIRGSEGRVRAISGGPAEWVRLKCNQPLPMRPSDFRFEGIDGRGSQTLVGDPNSNNGIAIVRIVDNRGGMQGYTGDIMWNGGSGAWNGPGWNGNNPGNWNGGGNNSGDWGYNVISNCQRTIRSQAASKYNASVNFNGPVNQNRAGSFIMVDGTANVRRSNGQSGNIHYHCTMHPNGNLADSSYNVVGGNLPSTPQPR